jgi:hypothetical protein
MAGEFLLRGEIEAVIHSGIKQIAKQAARMEDNAFQDVTSSSWTGGEWLGLRTIRRFGKYGNKSPGEDGLLNGNIVSKRPPHPESRPCQW